jgi:glycosyltransferase involved in cell wall biosynthesis
MREIRQPKLLFLAWNFPPVQTIGSIRTWNIAKHLSRLGWDVTVVTPKIDIWRHLDDVDQANGQMSAEGIRRILTEHHWRFLVPDHFACWNEGIGWFFGGLCRKLARSFGIDDGIGWITAAEKSCRMLRAQDVDLILSSGPPFASFILAERLARKLARPYVLDYRDVWGDLDKRPPFLHAISVRIEASVLARAAGVTAVSPSLAAALESRFGLANKLQVVTNGYDGEELSNIKAQEFDHFAIVYAGIFYPPERVITPVLEALRRLDTARRSRPWCFHYYGDHNDHVRGAAAGLGLLHRIKLHGRVPRSEALSAIRGANLAVVVTSVFEKGSLRINAVPGKLFEAIGLAAPILLIAPPYSDAESIAQTEGFVRRYTGSDVDGIASGIERLMWGRTPERRHKGHFEWKRLAERLDGYLRLHLRHSDGELGEHGYWKCAAGKSR